jgi:hypothetical protein
MNNTVRWLNKSLGLGLFAISCTSLAAPSLQGTLTVGSDWGDGYCAKVYLKNTGTMASTTWTAKINLGSATFRDNFSSVITGTTGVITATPGEFNAVINPGAEKNFGFCALGTARPTLMSVTIPGGGTASSVAPSSVPASSRPASSVAPSSTPASSRPASSVAPSSVPASSVAPSSVAPSSVAPSSRSSSSASSRGKIGKFDLGRDLLLVFHDNKPDPDDIHAQAAIGTILRDPRFAGIKYHAVQGTIGGQPGTQLNSSSLFDIAYAGNWSNALGSASNRANALNTVTTKSINALDAGGQVWIVEAGQSDFSADLVRNIKERRPSVNTKTRVHIVQHSDYNERHTNSGDLSYVKTNTDYNKIGDGNRGEGTSPDLNSDANKTTYWARALALPNPADDMWREARRLTDTLSASFSNTTIKNGGMDFSDTVEALWIFELNDEVKAASDDIIGFFNEFDGGGGSGTTSSASTSSSAPVPPNKTYVESGGLVVIDMETLSAPSDWKKETGLSSFGSGFITWTGGDNFTTTGVGTIDIPVRISSAGRYIFEVRNIIRLGTTTTDANDTWVKILAPRFYGVKDSDGHIVCPAEKPASNSCVGDLPIGATADGWFKFYRSGGTASVFTWSTLTSDRESGVTSPSNGGHRIFADFTSPGVYRVLISGRSNNHGLDRIVLYRVGNPSGNVTPEFAQNGSRVESAKE